MTEDQIAVVKAYLDGETVQWRSTMPGEPKDWFDKHKSNSEVKFTFHCNEYRIKPKVKTLQYRVALFGRAGQHSTGIWESTDNTSQADLEKYGNFIRWLTETQSVELPEE